MPRGLGFFPDAVVIRSHPVLGPAQLYNDDDDEYPRARDDQTVARPWAASSSSSDPVANAYAARLRPQGPDSWELWKDWHTNPSGHGGRSRAPPVFVRAKGHDLPATEAIAVVEVAVEPQLPEPVEEEKEKMDGGGVADWYLSLFSGKGKGKEDKGKEGMVEQPRSEASRTSASSSTATLTRPTPLRSPSTASSAAPSRDSSAPPPIKVHSSEWFIRRALAKAPAVEKRISQPSSIASLIDVDAAKPRPPPAPRFRYAIGPDNAGFARLEALGWAGGGLGRPEGWQGDVFEHPGGSRGARSGLGSVASSQPDSRAASAPAEAVVDLTADSDDDIDIDIDEAPQHGPGRTAPVPTVLKLDRLGLGRKSGKKKVTHTVKEIERAHRQSRGVRARPEEPEPGMPKKEKLKWKERDRRDRESRARIAAALNS